MGTALSPAPGAQKGHSAMTTRSVRTLSAGTIAALAASLVLAACSSSSSSSSSSSGSSSTARPSASSAASALPTALQGALTNPVMLYPPYGLETKDGKPGGAYTALSDALAKELGLNVTNKVDDFGASNRVVEKRGLMVVYAVIR